MKKVLIIIVSAVILPALLLLPSMSGKAGSIDIAIVGDILLDRGVGREVSNKGLEYPWLKVRDILSRADIALGNLECPLTRETDGILKNRNLLFKGNPANAPILKQAGFEILNLANNHSMDYGSKGFEDTLKTLKEAGIATVGGGMNAEAAAKPIFINKAGMTIGFMALSAFPPEGYFFSNNKPDAAHVDDIKTANDIRHAKNRCDFLIVSFHWGREFDFYPDGRQKAMAHSAIDNGADLVIGHHPHVLQGVEEYRGGMVFYSLGNFVFDRQVRDGTDETMILIVSVDGGLLKKAEILPVRISECQPRLATGNDANHILERIKLYSVGFKTNFDIKGDSAEYIVGNPAN